MYRILSLDGGGVYGCLTSIIVDRLAEKHPNFIENIDLIAGTSSGGIIALALAHGFSPSGCVQIFTDRVSEIFPKSFVRQFLAYAGLMPFYDDRGKRNVMMNMFGDAKLKDLKKKVVVPTFEINNSSKQWHIKLFHNFQNPLGANTLTHFNANSRNVLVSDVATATSAAPVSFPSYGHYIDGGVLQDNPAMAAVAQVLDPMCIIQNRPNLEEISVLSIGTTLEGDYIDQNIVNWGWLGWIQQIFKIFIHGNITTTDYQCKQILGDHYFKICPFLSSKLNKSLDRVDLVPDLVEYGRKMDLSFADDWIQSNWK